jgi:hypothetical protein
MCRGRACRDATRHGRQPGVPQLPINHLGNVKSPEVVATGMTTIEQIHAEIDELSERRAELWHRLSEGRDPDSAEELKDVEARLEALWSAHRAERARIRFGEREDIVKRARAEERLERAA